MLESPFLSHRLVRALLALAVVAALAGFARSSAAEAGYQVVGPDLEPFRSTFNAASDDVRAVLLVGPT